MKDHEKPSEGDTLQAEHNSMLQLHLAEYQALTTRNTYWITLQFALWPILLIYFALVAQVWNSMARGLLVWGSGLVTQTVVLTLYWTGFEQYNNIRYIERELRPLVNKLVGNRQFWRYERYLKPQRTSWYMLGECAPSLLTFIGLVVVARLRIPWLRSDYYWALCNASLYVVVAVTTVHLIRTRRDFFAN